jgi:small-conductance mechanosensitive channel
MPNGIVFTQPQINYNWGFYHIWHEIPILITFEGDWKRAKAILTKILNDHALEITDTAEKQIKAAGKKFRIHYTSLIPEVFTTVKDSGVHLTMRFLCDPLKRRSDEQVILENVLEEFAKYDNIDFAYPTTRFYDNLGEGKIGTKPK